MSTVKQVKHMPEIILIIRGESYDYAFTVN